jgi:hypothetical protein
MLPRASTDSLRSVPRRFVSASRKLARLSKPLPAASARASMRPGNSLFSSTGLMSSARVVSFQARGLSELQLRAAAHGAVEHLHVVLRTVSCSFESTPLAEPCACGRSGPSTCAVVVKS